MPGKRGDVGMTGYDLSAWPLFRSVIEESRDEHARARRCFVLGPMDDDNLDVRRHTDAVWKYIIRPALLDTDYAARRADPEITRGLVSQPVIDGLLDDDLVIAIVSFRNPNVFYEVALAQAAARPLILLIEEGQDISFDPRGAPLVSYSLDTDSVFSAVNVKRLQAAIRQVSEAPPLDQPFRPGGAALNAGARGGATVYDRSQLFTYERRLAMVREAVVRIDVMGIANLALALHPDTAEILRSRAGSGVEIRILQCAPSNPGLVSLIGPRNLEGLSQVKAEIDAAADAWRRIAEISDLDLSITVRRAQTSIPLASALITDQAVIATPYLASRTTAESLAWHAVAGATGHRIMSQEFDQAWSEAATLFRVEPSRTAHRQAPANINIVRPGAAVHSTHSPAVQAPPAPASAGQHLPHVQFVDEAQHQAQAPQPQTPPPSTLPASGGVLRGFAAIRGLGSSS